MIEVDFLANPAVALPLVILGAYLLGSFPTSILIGRVFFGKDPRGHGSGNAGGTNSFRVFGWKAGILVTLVDIGKGALAVFLAGLVGAKGSTGFLPGGEEALALLAGLAAVAGHVWTVFAGFRGGKGVATAAGVLLSLAPLPSLGAALVFGAVLFSTGIVSLSSISAALALALVATAMRLLGFPITAFLLAFSWILVPLILFTHRANIGRLLRKEEKSFERLKLFHGSRRKTGERD